MTASTLANRIAFIAASAGTGPFVFGSGVTSFLTLAQGVALGEITNGKLVSYIAQDSTSSPTQAEWGQGTFSSAGSGLIVRTTVYGTNNNGVVSSGTPLAFSMPPTILLTVLSQDIVSPPVRTILTANANFYVATTGSDSNDGSLAHPWATLQHAMSVISGTLDFAGLAVTINIGAGTFAGVGLQTWVGGGTLNFLGAGSGSTTITNANSDLVTNFGECVAIFVGLVGTLTFDKIKFKPNQHGVVIFNDVFDVFAPCKVNLENGFNDIAIDCTGMGSGDVVFWIDAPGANFLDNTITITGGTGIHVQNVFLIENGATYAHNNNGNRSTINGNLICDNSFAAADTYGILTSGDQVGYIQSGTVTGTGAFVATAGYIGAQTGQIPLATNYFPGSVTNSPIVDPSSSYDNMSIIVAEHNPANTTVLSNHLFPRAWCAHKDIDNGQRVIAFNDGGTIYWKQIGRVVNTQTINYTLALTDQDGRVEMNLAGANTLTVPLNATVAFPIGTEVRVVQVGAGATTIAGAVGVTVDAAGVVGGQWKSVMLYKRGTDEWVQTNV